MNGAAHKDVWMELRQLRYFLTAAESGSLSKASSVLGIAQPALGRQIRQLEEGLGAPLFYRHGRGIRLTAEGERFHAAVAPLVRDLLQSRDEMRASAGVPRGDVTLGLPPSFSSSIGAELVIAVHRDYPGLRLHLVDGFSGFVNEWLASGRVDMAIINNARRTPHIRMDPLLTADLYLLGRRREVETLAPGCETIAARRLAELPLILPGRHHGLRRELDQTAQALGFSLEIVAELDALAALKALVREGFAFTVLPQGAILPDDIDNDLAVRRIVDPAATMRFMLAYSQQRPMTLGMRAIAKSIGCVIARSVASGRLTGRIDSARHPPSGADPA